MMMNDEPTGDGDSHDQRQRHSQSRLIIVEQNDRTDDKCRQAADAQRSDTPA